MGFVFSSPCCDVALFFWGWLNTCLPMGSGKFLDLLCLCMCLLLSLISCLYLNPWVFSLLPSWFCPPSCWWLNLRRHYKLHSTIKQTDFMIASLLKKGKYWISDFRKKLFCILRENYIRTLLKLSTPRQLFYKSS